MLDFIITGPSRSGTTGLTYLLNSSSEVLCGHETHVLDYWDKDISDRIRNNILEKMFYSDRTPSILDFTPKGVTPDMLKTIVETSSTGKELFDRLNSIAKCNCVGDKVPGYIVTLPQILKNNPQLKLLICIRDGRSILASHLRGLEPGWATDNIKDTEERIVIFMNIINNIENHDKVIYVPYEHYTQHTDFLIRRLESFLDTKLSNCNTDKYRDYTDWDDVFKQLPKDYMDKVSPEFIEYQKKFGYSLV